MADTDTVGFTFPDITEPAVMWAYLETFPLVEAVIIPVKDERETVTLPGVIFPDASIQDEHGVASYFAVACEKGKEPFLLVVLVQTNGEECRFRVGADAHGWAFLSLERGTFVIVREKDDNRVLGIPCFRTGEDAVHERTVTAFEALACAWQHRQGTHAPKMPGDPARTIAVSEEEITAFKAAYPLYPLGEALVATSEAGEKFTMPMVYYPDGLTVPAAPAGTQIRTTLALALEGTGEPVLGIKVEIEGEPEAFRFGVPGRLMGWAVEAVTKGVFCAQPEAVLNGKNEVKLEGPERWKHVMAFSLPPPGESHANDQILHLFLTRSETWQRRQRMN